MTILGYSDENIAVLKPEIKVINGIEAKHLPRKGLYPCRLLFASMWQMLCLFFTVL